MRRALLLAAIPGLLGVGACQRRAETPMNITPYREEFLPPRGLAA